ncbi:MAG: acyltransferase [Cyclobacteriaceae bacterium]
MAGSKFLPYINHLRGLAIVLIVGIHCRTSFEWGKNYYQDKFWFSLIVYGTIVFVFISGFLFQHVNKTKFKFRDYIIKKIKYVVLPYFIVSTPAIINKLYFDSPEPWQSEFYNSLSILGKYFYMICTGKHMGPFWFIPMITIVYIISPFLIYLDRSKYFYKYVFPIVFIGGLFLHDFGHNTSVVNSFLYFIPIYLLGIWSSKNAKAIVNLSWPRLTPFLIIYVGIFMMEFLDILAIGKTYGFAEDARQNIYAFNFGKLKMILVCLVLMNVLYRFNSSRFRSLDILAQYSFGVFFIHLYVIRSLEILIKHFLGNLNFNSVTFIVFLTTVTGLCILIVSITKRLLGRKSRYIIGS